MDQDVLSEFQRSPFFKEMATNWLAPASFCVAGYHLGGHFILPEGRRPSGDMNDHLSYILKHRKSRD